MKKIIILSALVLLAGTITAQSTDEEIDYLQAMFGMEKRAALQELISLEDLEKEAFWNLYNEYESIRKEYGKERIQLLESAVERFDKMSEEESDIWMKEVLALRMKNEKLIGKYYKKIRKECTATTAMQFYQFESYILAGIRFQILESLPF